ncbi:MAG: VanZ family protein [Solirubrobacterales bacterium]
MSAAFRATAPLALMGLIFYLSAQSDPGADIGTVGRILAHFGEYALLASLWAWALAPALGRRAIVAAAAIAFLYALSDEWHQSFVAGRDADPLDVVIDGVGIAVVSLALRARRAGEPELSGIGPTPRN